jgi:hypothetical protein
MISSRPLRIHREGMTATGEGAEEPEGGEEDARRRRRPIASHLSKENGPSQWYGSHFCG